MIDTEDNLLIQEVLNGIQVAQKTLYDKYKKIVKEFLKRKYSNYKDIDDDVSEIMIKIMLNLSSYDQTKGNLKSWVYSITKNYMIDKWRCSTQSNTISINNITAFPNSLEIAYDSNTSSNYYNAFTCDVNSWYASSYDACNSVTFITDQLSASDYAMLDMKYVQGYNYNEIGVEFNSTSNTVSNRVNYIKTKLKKNFSEII